MHEASTNMKFVKPVQDIVDNILGNSHGIEVVPTFIDDPRETLSCIVHELGTQKYGLVSVNVENFEGDKNDVNCFIFNGKMYDYCKAEGFTQDQMVKDKSFENKVMTSISVNKFIGTFTNK